MKSNIRLLDCTLRDGGHIVQGVFGEAVIKNIIEQLIEAGVDIIEVGFLWDKYYGPDLARYYSIDDVKRILPANSGDSKFSLMADFIDLDHLEPYDGTIEYIRLSFKRWRLDWGLKTAELLMNKGYKVIINPVNNNVYSDNEYIEVLQKVNELHPYGFSIVDTFGVMRINDLSHRYYLVENNLLPDITIGVHLHENLGLAYSLAQHMTHIVSPKRKIIIDGSLLGMGRVPGNLCIEQMMDFMNAQFGTNYHTDPVYDVIDDYIAPIKKEKPWGYAIPYALSAKYKLHRTYAEHLLNKERLKTKDIQRILSQIDLNQAETFNAEYIDRLYMEYMDVKYDDSKDIAQLKIELAKYDEVLIIAPGQSILGAGNVLKKVVNKNICIISVNFIYDVLNVNYCFFSNVKRLAYARNFAAAKMIITSNLIDDAVSAEFVLSRNDLTYHDDIFCDDSTMMVLNLLKRLGKKKVYIAGFDGFQKGKVNFYNNGMERKVREDDYDPKSKIQILKNTYSNLNITFLTPSIYQTAIE